jgi:hypothetical protein
VRFIVILVFILTGNICLTGQYQFFELKDLILPKELNNKIYSLDSIISMKNSQGIKSKYKFLVNEKNIEHYIIKSRFENVTSENNSDTIFCHLSYYDKERFEHVSNTIIDSTGTIDTTWQIKYDEEKRMLLHQFYTVFDRFEGVTLEKEKFQWIYDNSGKLINKKERIFLKTKFGIIPANKWVTTRNEEYFYKQDTIQWKYTEYLYYSFWANYNDTLLTPSQFTSYKYLNNKLVEVNNQKWSKSLGDWSDDNREEYHYQNDTIIREYYLYWEPDTLWYKMYRSIITKADTFINEYRQNWNDITQLWENLFYEYYIPSNVPGKFDYFYKVWDKNNQLWNVKRYNKYSLNNDTLILESYDSDESSYHKYFLYFNSDEQLFKEKFFFSRDSVNWVLTSYNLIDYDEIGLEIKETEENYDNYGNHLSYKDTYFYWHEYDKTNSNVIEQPIIQIAHPNPANDIIYINDQIDLSKAEIYNLNGKQIKSFKEHSVDISRLNPGVYVFVVHCKNGNTLITKITKL